MLHCLGLRVRVGSKADIDERRTIVRFVPANLRYLGLDAHFRFGSFTTGVVQKTLHVIGREHKLASRPRRRPKERTALVDPTGMLGMPAPAYAQRVSDKDIVVAYQRTLG